MWKEIKMYFWCKKHGLNYINWGLIERKIFLKRAFKENFLMPVKMVAVPGLTITAIINPGSDTLPFRLLFAISLCTCLIILS